MRSIGTPGHTAAILALLATAVLPASTTLGQGSRQDYERSAVLEKTLSGKVFRQRLEPQWLSEGDALWYRVETGPGKAEYVWVDLLEGERRLAFDHGQLARLLGQATNKPVNADALPIDKLQWGKRGEQLTFRAFGSTWKWDVGDDALQRQDAEQVGREGLEPLREFRRSGGSDIESAITFENRLEQPIELFWIPSTGDERGYGKIAAGESREQHTFAGHVWRVADERGRTLAMFVAAESPARAVVDDQVKPPAGRPRPGRSSGPRRGDQRSGDTGPRSPDGQWETRFQDHNVELRSTGAEYERLTTDGGESDGYEGPVIWSPDSRYFVAWRVSRVATRQVHLIESSPRDQLQPKLHSLEYAKPGDPLPQRRPRLFRVADRQLVPLDDALVENSWSVSDPRWLADSSRFTVVYNQRGHQHLALLGYDPVTGQGQPLIDERSDTFIDYAHKQFLHILDTTREALWMSERDGWNHLYLYDLDRGQVKHPVTSGKWVVRSVERVDEASRQVWLRVAGVDPSQDPYHVHLARVGLDGMGFTVLTSGDGTHRWEFSPDGRYFVDSWSRVDQPPVHEVRASADGRLICELERADIRLLLETGWRPPERFVAKGRDGETDIHGIVVRPMNFDSSRKWPIVEQIYAGPQSSYVPKEWGLQLGLRQMAELGFVVVQLDGMGTSHRGKAFHDVCHRNLGDAGFPDRRKWITELASRYPELDLTRVGIYGGSAGGQNAVRALLAHGDFYHVAVADCGCHDNRMDKIWWNELWMGWPVGPHYEQQSNVTQAHHLTGKLLLIVGELDRNVDPASTMQVVDALVRADKDFDLLVIPGAGHGSAESPYGRRRRMDFFTRHLLRVEPRHDGDSRHD